MRSASETERKVLAVASAGGHWVQLQRLLPAFQENTVSFLSTNVELRALCPGRKIYSVQDANMEEKRAMLWMAFQIFWIVLKVRPDVVITTGAAPGYFALMWGKLFGAKTIWIDSIANAEKLSLAGRRAKFWADHWLTQWPELAGAEGPTYLGAVL